MKGLSPCDVARHGASGSSLNMQRLRGWLKKHGAWCLKCVDGLLSRRDDGYGIGAPISSLDLKW